MNKRQKKKSRKLQRGIAHRALDLVLDLTDAGNDSFFWYSGHVDSISVNGHRGKWSNGKENAFDEMVYLDGRHGKGPYEAVRLLETMKKELSHGM